MTALDTKALLEGVTPGDWFVDEDDREGMGWNRHICSGYSDRICFMSNTGDDPKGEANARLIASAPRLARRVIEIETERDAYMAALRWVYENGLPHDSKRPDFVNQAFSDAYAPNRAALNGEG